MILRKIFFTISLCLVAVFSFGQSIVKTVEGNNAFAFELNRELFDKVKNVFFSPYSISSALAMTYAGARGETEKQMSKVLHYDINQENTHKGFFEINSSLARYKNDGAIKLSIANALWKDDQWGFKQNYLELTKKYYNASIFTLTNAKPINDWADKNTNGKIKEIVTEEDLGNARLVLTNAIYFKGDWLNKFDSAYTKKGKFSTLKNGVIDVDMMFQVNEIKYFEDQQNQVIELPYQGEKMSMTVILPKENSSIENLSNTINDSLNRYYQSKLSKQEVYVSIPKFSFTSEFHLEDELPQMGMPDAFDDIKANFTGMSNGLRISSVIHKAFIEVNEKGSEAAAVTAVVMVEKSAINRKIVFNADRPFMILINDKQTGSILFMGSIMNPNEK